MPYPKQYLILTDQRLQILLSRLNVKNVNIGFTECVKYNWSRNGVSTSVIDIDITRTESAAYLTLRYSLRGVNHSHKVDLLTKPSNLPSGGKVWYMICPKTGQLCRKLYFDGKDGDYDE